MVFCLYEFFSLVERGRTTAIQELLDANYASYLNRGAKISTEILEHLPVQLSEIEACSQLALVYAPVFQSSTTLY